MTRVFSHLVDSNDKLRVLHACKMLDGARDTHGDVERRSNDLASLADLLAVVRVARVDSSTRGTDSSVESVGKRQDDLVKVLLGLGATATGHDRRRRAQVGSL